VKFLIDNQLPPALARFIETNLLCEAKHVADVDLREVSDAEVWRYATANDFVLVSKDEDFTQMSLRSADACLIWVRVGNCRRVALLDLFRRLWPTVLGRLGAGDRFIEIR
jgi:predicted nuclease of predicted toxin-antitoxin system